MDNRITIILELLSAGVIASLVAGIFSLVIAFKNNKRLVELEKSKQKFTVNQERYKGLREAYAELLNVLPEEKLLGHIIINLPSQKNFQENGLSEAYEAADMNMKIMYSHFQKHGYLLSDDEQKEIIKLIDVIDTTATLKELLQKDYKIVDNPPPVGKDFNDFLLSYLEIARPMPKRERSDAR